MPAGQEVADGRRMDQRIDSPTVATPVSPSAFDSQLLERLTLYARRRCARVTGPRIEQPADYVSRAVVETLSGRRVKPPQISMFAHMAGVISSLVSHDAETAENRTTRAWPERALGDGDSQPMDFTDDRPNPEEAVVEAEEAGRQQRLTMHVLKALADAPDLRRLAVLIMNAPGPIPPRQLADELGCSASDIYNMRKQLQRRLGFLVATPGGGEP
jgi:DNA-directed RNA polymerase specialized sigma24 family protein